MTTIDASISPSFHNADELEHAPKPGDGAESKESRIIWTSGAPNAARYI